MKKKKVTKNKAFISLNNRRWCVQTAMSIKVYNSWLFWWCHPQWEFDSHSPPVRLIWWWFFARFPSSERWVHRERELRDWVYKKILMISSLLSVFRWLYFWSPFLLQAPLCVDGVKAYWCGKAAFWPLFFNPSGIWSWRKQRLSLRALPEKNTLEPNLMRLSKQT